MNPLLFARGVCVEDVGELVFLIQFREHTTHDELADQHVVVDKDKCLLHIVVMPNFPGGLAI